MDRGEALARIAAEAEGGELVFPTHAEVSLRVRLALEDPDLHLEAAVRAVQAEPLLASRVVALANSVVFNRAGHAIADVRSAVSLLGFQLIRSLATALIMRQMVGATSSPEAQEMARRLWQHSAQIGALAHVLAARQGRCNPDVALFAGIVHEVGGFYLISRADAYPGLLWRELAPAWTGAEQRVVGRAVLRALRIPEAAVSAIEGQRLGTTSLPAHFPEMTLGDILFLAHGLSPVDNPLMFTDGAEMPAATREQIAATTLGAILLESAAELESLSAALRF
ncbi:MAG TPA: HDOD domain-containing protein [Rhodocyclaceae bacterium]|nr:HDOD domain-containing protein [Rhodocyclaceae bacterium]